MSRKEELYLNLCYFLKSFINEVDIEPTNAVKDVTRDLCSALLELSKRLNCSLETPLSQNKNDHIKSVDGAESVSTQLNGFIRPDNKNHEEGELLRLGSNSRKAPIPDGTKLSNETRSLMTNILPDSNLTTTHSKQGDLMSDSTNKSKILPLKQNSTAKKEVSDKCTVGPKTVDGTGGLHHSEPSKKFLPQVKTEAVSVHAGKAAHDNFVNPPPSVNSEILENIPKLFIGSNLDTIPQAFIELDKCLMNKLISGGFYCWMCGLGVDDINILKNHLSEHKALSIEQKFHFKLISICQSCSFFAVAPPALEDKLLSHHEAQHRKKALHFKGLEHNHFRLVQSLIKSKFQEENTIPNFLGICLFCEVYFSTPLEWQCHIYEFSHLKTPTEIVKTCTPCSIVILGSDSILFKNDFLRIPEHVSNCRGNKCR